MSSPEERYSVGIAPAGIGIEDTAVTVGTSATQLPGTALDKRRTLLIYNNGSAIIYIGPSGVTTSSGFPMAVGSALALSVAEGVAVYAISGSASQNVRVLELA